MVPPLRPETGLTVLGRAVKTRQAGEAGGNAGGHGGVEGAEESDTWVNEGERSGMEVGMEY